MWFVILTAAAAAAADPLDAVVLIRQGSATCAGVHVGGGAVATAYHCVASGGRPAVTARDGAGAVGRVRAVARREDLAVIDVALPGLPALAIGAAAAPGAPIRALGHPLAAAAPAGWYAGTLRWSVSEGVVAAVGARALQVTAALNPGNSGGPVVDAGDRVIGVVSRRLAPGVGFAARSDGLVKLLAADRAVSPLGGTLAVHGVGLTQTGGDGGVAVGARAELAARDRLFLDVSAYVPTSPRWTAARFGAASSAVAEGRVGLRQRIGRGPWALRVDAAAGLAAVQRWTAPAADPFDQDVAVTPAVSWAGQVSTGTAGLELGWVPALGQARASVVLRWPGVVRAW